MRAPTILSAFVLAGLSAVAWTHAAASQTPAAQQPPAAPQSDAARIDALQQRLLASQQTIATLERELAAAKNRAVVMEECRAKNGQLVFISRELIEGYAKRYQQTHKDPLQMGRRRFEFELQALSDAVYTSRIDVPAPPLPGEKRQAETPDAAPDAAPGAKKRDQNPSAETTATLARPAAKAN